MSLKQAINIIRDGKGQRFDPAVVDALLELVEEEKKRQIGLQTPVHFADSKTRELCGFYYHFFDCNKGIINGLGK